MRVLYFSEIQWLSQVSRKHLIVRRFPGDWDVLFLSPFNLKADENSFRTRRDAAHAPPSDTARSRFPSRIRGPRS